MHYFGFAQKKLSRGNSYKYRRGLRVASSSQKHVQQLTGRAFIVARRTQKKLKYWYLKKEWSCQAERLGRCKKRIN